MKTVHCSLFTVHGQKGLTLIEVLVAVTLLAIGLLGVAMMQVTSISSNAFSREMSVATELGQDLIEKLKSSTYTAATEDPTLIATVTHTNAELFDAFGHAQPNPIDGRGMATDAAGASVPLRLYTRIWTVTDNTPAANMKSIEVRVEWNDNTGTLHAVTLEGVKVQE